MARVILIFLYLIFIGLGQASEKTWEQELEYWNQLRFQKKFQEKEILVSVTVTDRPKGLIPPQSLNHNGAFYVGTYAKSGFQRTKGFQFLKNMKEYIKSYKWNEKNKSLYIKGQAFKYHAQLWMKFEYHEIQSKEGPLYEIRWTHTKGLFTGMKGVLRFKDIGRRKHQITMTARYNFSKLPLPKFFVQFGLEVVLQKAAFKLRQYIEHEGVSASH